MRYLKRFPDLILENILLEKVLIFHDRLLGILNRMKNPIAKQIVNIYTDRKDVVDNSYIDYDKQDGMVSYLPANREVDRSTGQDVQNKWTVRGRQQISIGRLVRAILQKSGISFTESEIEGFVNEYKSMQKPSKFELVKGDDIKKYYNENNYDNTGDYGWSLFNSCMRSASCSDFMAVYTLPESEVQLLVLFNNENSKVMGRAIVWNKAIIGDGKEVVYMDRIYTKSEDLVLTFKNYAEEHGWWYKEQQSASVSAITNGEDKLNTPLIKAEIPNVDWKKYKKPYMDSLYVLGYENNTEDDSLHAYLYNVNYKDSVLRNRKEEWRSQYGGEEENMYYDKKYDVFKKKIGRGLSRPIKFIQNNFDETSWVDDSSITDLVGDIESDKNNTIISLINLDKQVMASMVVYINVPKGDDTDYYNMIITKFKLNNRVVDRILLENNIVKFLIKYKPKLDYKYMATNDFNLIYSFTDMRFMKKLMTDCPEYYTDFNIVDFDLNDKDKLRVFLEVFPDKKKITKNDYPHVLT